MLRSFPSPIQAPAIRTRRRRSFASLGILASCLVLGCGSRNENLADVTGTVILDGQPLENALVVFAPRAGGTTSYGRTDEQGRYRMMFNDAIPGAWLGESVVHISTADLDPTTGKRSAGERVPVNYNQNSKLTANVVPGSNVFDFQLDSHSGRIIQGPAE